MIMIIIVIIMIIIVCSSRLIQTFQNIIILNIIINGDFYDLT